MKCKTAVDNVRVWSAEQLSVLFICLLFYVCIQRSSIHDTAASLQDCTQPREVSTTPLGRVEIPACSSRPREENDADCELFMWLSVEEDTVGAVSAQRHPSLPSISLQLDPCPGYHILCTGCPYTVYRVPIVSWLLSVQLVSAKFDPPVACVICHYSSHRVPWLIVTVYISYLIFTFMVPCIIIHKTE
jgi:hypothetical protein